METLFLDKMPSDMQLICWRRSQNEREGVAKLMKLAQADIVARRRRNHMRVDLSEDSNRSDKREDSGWRSSQPDRRS